MRWLQNHELYPRLPMKHKSILPDEGFDSIIIELTPGLFFPVFCTPADGGRHRVKVRCSCGHDIPFGRMGQHYKGRYHKPLQGKGPVQ